MGKEQEISVQSVGKMTKRNTRTLLQSLPEHVADRMHAVESTMQIIGIDTFKGDALAYLMMVYKNNSLNVRDRLQAAKIAVQHEVPRIANLVPSQIETSGTTGPDLPIKENYEEWIQRVHGVQTIEGEQVIDSKG